MKNRFYKKLKFIALSVLLVLGTNFSAKADIINEVVTATPPMYVTGASQLVLFDVYFESNTLEWLDAVEFNPPAGISLTHDIPSDLGIERCPGVNGAEMPSSVSIDGIAWANPAAPTGGSLCGPYLEGITFTFGVLVTADAQTIGDITIDVVLYGDGFGGQASTVTVQVTLAGPPCVITCPPDIVIGNDPGMCGADVTISLPTDNGFCTTGSLTNMDGFYPVGTTPVVFTSDPGVECTVNVTVNDVEDPVINNCNDIIVDLGPGDCETIVNFDIDVTDNCGTLPVALSHNVNPDLITNAFACEFGTAQFLQIFDLGSEGVDNDFDIDNVNLGVWESNGLANVTVNIYELNGSLNYGNMTLLGSNTLVIPNMSLSHYDFPVFATASGGSTIVVEVVVPGSSFATFVMGVNDLGSTGLSYYASNTCAVPQPLPF